MGKSKCSKCGSSQLYHRAKTDTFRCATCGEIITREDLKEGSD